VVVTEGSEAEEIIDRIAETATHLVDAQVALLGRLAEGSSADPEEDRRGAMQDAWMTWAEGAGDMVTISYLTAQFFDAVLGTDRPPRHPEE
jgi:hypothetical protein